MYADEAMQLKMTVSRRSILPDDGTLTTLLQRGLCGREATYQVAVTTHGHDVEIRVWPRPDREAHTMPLLMSAAHDSPAAETTAAP
jgi:hypothetical protein